MENRLLMLLIALIFVSVHVDGQGYKLYGCYGKNDARVRASFGLIPDRKFENIRPVSDLKTNRILVFTEFDNNVEITYKPFFPTELPKRSLSINVEDYIDSLFISKINNGRIKYIFIDKVDKVKIPIVTNKWDGELKIKDKINLTYIREKYNTDYLIVLIGGGFVDFLRGTQYPFQAHGLFINGKEKFVYAGHRIGVFDLKTGKIIENGYSIQASANISETDYQKSFKSINSKDFNALEKEIKDRIMNNIDQTVKILKINN